MSTKKGILPAIICTKSETRSLNAKMKIRDKNLSLQRELDGQMHIFCDYWCVMSAPMI